MTTKAEYHAENVRRAKNVDAAANAFACLSGAVATTKSSNGRGQLLVDADLLPVVSAQAKKADRAALHARVKGIEGRLSDNAARALDLIVRKDEQFGGSRLIDVVVHQLASALDLPEKDAQEAREELERLGLITWYDNFSGDRGFRPKV